ncbi:hypothetical protein [Gorillibacterium sp. sgz500922]|uniref:hypothetical protein n=1 Tax=Gorillibacterium sp. sgz500922 TaxID=3446694 RepID=UPI003F671780
MYPNPILAFLLSFVPGLGHFYLNRRARAFLYSAGFFGALFLSLLADFAHSGEAAALLVLAAAGIWLINMLDALFFLLSPRRTPEPYDPRSDAFRPTSGPIPPYSGQRGANASAAQSQNERFYTILLSIIPGLGHLQLGLMQRGLTFLVSFFGLFALVGFVAFTTRVEGFLTFLLALPVIWLYAMFDAVQLVNRKQNGELLEDRSLFDDLEKSREEGKRSRMAATLLAILPGAGHMYLGLQTRGLQLMAGFLISIYLLDALHLSLFLLLIPLIWFYALFDALQTISKYGREPLTDKPLIAGLRTHHRAVGLGLIALGVYCLFQFIGLDLIDQLFGNNRFSVWFYRYFQSTAIAVLFIVGGVWLFLGERRDKNGRKGQ